jgi:hypothetical protein
MFVLKTKIAVRRTIGLAHVKLGEPPWAIHPAPGGHIKAGREKLRAGSGARPWSRVRDRTAKSSGLPRGTVTLG